MVQPTAAKFSIRKVLLLTLLLAIPIGGFFWWQYEDAKNIVVPVDYVTYLTGYIKRNSAEKLAPQFKGDGEKMVPAGPTNPSDVLDPEELVFSPGGFPDANTEVTWKPWLDHLAKATGKSVKYRADEDPRILMEALSAGQVHVTSFNTGFVPCAVNLCGFVPVAALAPADGTTSYSMEIIVPANSPVKSLNDLKGGKLMLTSAGSLSGYKAPLIVLRDDIGLQPGTDYEFVVSGGHRQSISAIARARDVNLAAPVASDLLADEVAKGTVIKAGQFRSIYKSKPIPKGAWGYSCRLKPELAAKVRAAILSFDLATSPIAEHFRGSGAVKFAPVDYQKDWAYVREIDQKMLNW